MSRFQRMICIPEEEYRQVMNLKTPVQQQFLNVQRQHDEQSQIKDPYARVLQQGITLDVMKSLKEKMKGNIASSTPKPFRGRANQLYSAVEPYIDFNERGELLDDSNRPIPESHIEDLVQYAVRDHRRNIPPRGWVYFLEKMRQINVPKVSLNRETIKELQKETEDGEHFKLGKDRRKLKGKRKATVIKTEPSVEEEFSPTQRRRARSRKQRHSSFIYY